MILPVHGLLLSTQISYISHMSQIASVLLIHDNIISICDEHYSCTHHLTPVHFIACPLGLISACILGMHTGYTA